MVFDHINNSKWYYPLGKKIEKALKFIKKNDLEQMVPGEYEIDGRKVFIIIQEHDTRIAADWESHQKYMDLQYIIQGEEKMGYANLDGLKLKQEYDKENDYALYEGTGDYLIMKSGFFALFGPEDAHKPSIAINESTHIKKAVVKIKI